jgi:hypothetical protein
MALVTRFGGCTCCAPSQISAKSLALEPFLMWTPYGAGGAGIQGYEVLLASA